MTAAPLPRDIPALELHDIRKSYGPNRVLDGISLTVMPGEITALLGENGAGKSTLAHIIAGATRPDGGAIRIAGAAQSFSQPRDALAIGVSAIPQELVYVPQMSVADNILLGRWGTRTGLLTGRSVQRRAREEMRRYGFDLPLSAPMRSLTLAQQQMAEILKAVARDARLILLDEPTAALSNKDAERLLALVRRLADEGVAVVYVSHRLEEVFRNCDSVHVLRNGRLVQSLPMTEVTPAGIVDAMLGREAAHREVAKAAHVGTDPVAELIDFRVPAASAFACDRLDVRTGEIVGVYGIQGSGADTLAEALGGMHPGVDGDVRIAGRTVNLPSSPRRARRAGIAYVPADRKSNGLSLNLSVGNSLAVAHLRGVSRAGFVSRAKQATLVRTMFAQLLIRARSAAQTVGLLSGGNQQKVLIGSRLAMGQPFLVLHEPSRGVDVGARTELHERVRSIADDGAGVLVVTSDIEEAVLLSDRLHIVRAGGVVHTIDHPDLDSQAEAIRHAGGIQ